MIDLPDGVTFQDHGIQILGDEDGWYYRVRCGLFCNGGRVAWVIVPVTNCNDYEERFRKRVEETVKEVTGEMTARQEGERDLVHGMVQIGLCAPSRKWFNLDEENKTDT